MKTATSITYRPSPNHKITLIFLNALGGYNIAVAEAADTHVAVVVAVAEVASYASVDELGRAQESPFQEEYLQVPELGLGSQRDSAPPFDDQASELVEPEHE